MKNKFTKIILLAGLAMFASNVYAGAPMKMEKELIESPTDSKKKKAGEECKASDECQRHHTCGNAGAKNICIAAPPPHIPPPT